MTQHILKFGNNSELCGVLTSPQVGVDQLKAPIVLMFNPGSVHKIGINRFHVRFARELAKIGMASFRMDFAGIGDSARRSVAAGVSVEDLWLEDAELAMAELKKVSGAHSFVLFGNCSGARMALKFLGRTENKIAGTIALNLEGEGGRAAYMADMALNSDILVRKFKAKPSLLGSLLSRNEDENATLDNGDETVLQTNQELIEEAVTKTNVPCLMVHSQWDAGRLWAQKHLKEFGKKHELPSHFSHIVLEHMDHDVSLASGQARLLEALVKWIKAQYPVLHQDAAEADWVG